MFRTLPVHCGDDWFILYRWIILNIMSADAPPWGSLLLLGRPESMFFHSIFLRELCSSFCQHTRHLASRCTYYARIVPSRWRIRGTGTTRRTCTQEWTYEPEYCSAISEVERHKWYEHAWHIGCVWLCSRLSIVVPSSCMLNSTPLFMHALFMHASSVFVLN